MWMHTILSIDIVLNICCCRPFDNPHKHIQLDNHHHHHFYSKVDGGKTWLKHKIPWKYKNKTSCSYEIILKFKKIYKIEQTNQKRTTTSTWRASTHTLCLPKSTKYNKELKLLFAIDVSYSKRKKKTASAILRLTMRVNLWNNQNNVWFIACD